MNPGQALDILDKTVATVSTDRASHATLNLAVATLKATLADYAIIKKTISEAIAEN